MRAGETAPPPASRATYGAFAGTGASSGQIESIEHQSRLEESLANDDEVSILGIRYWTAKARRRFVPVPSREEPSMWKECTAITNRPVLSNKGISALRSSLRAEAKERKETLSSLLAALTGMLGAATGPLAVVLR